MAEALVILSGGQDSTTCLYWALSQFDQVQTLTFDYGQRHRIELERAAKIASLANVPHQVLGIPTFAELGGNALTDQEDVRLGVNPHNQLPNTFVPGRNLIFLTFAAAYAYQRQICDLVTGVCETDYSGYPDCRDHTVKAMQTALNLGMDTTFQIHTPLMRLNKAETVRLAISLKAMEALAWSHTCYNGQEPPCGQCSACMLRQRGFEEAGIADPLLVRLGGSYEF